MALIDLASFPNSRIKPRPATRESYENNTPIAATTTVELRPELPERTSLTIYNNSLTATIRYKRGSAANIATEGFPLGPDRAIDLEGPESIHVHNPTGAPVTVSWDDSVG